MLVQMISKTVPPANRSNGSRDVRQLLALRSIMARRLSTSTFGANSEADLSAAVLEPRQRDTGVNYPWASGSTVDGVPSSPSSLRNRSKPIPPLSWYERRDCSLSPLNRGWVASEADSESNPNRTHL
jgi:hypothetical protein